MHRALRAIDEHRNAARMRELHDLFHRHYSAQRVRHLRNRDELGARTEQFLELVDEEIALLVDRRPLDHRTLTLAQEMPGHDIGVMLHNREDDLIASLDLLAPEGIGNQIDRLGSVARENNFFLALSIYKPAHSLSGGFVSLSRLVGEIV